MATTQGDDEPAPDKVCIVPHMGMGDMIILNGVVRVACRAFREVMLFVTKVNANGVRSLFCDIPNLRLKFVDHDHEIYADDFALPKSVLASGYELRPVGDHTTDDWRALDDIWSHAMYRQVGLDPDTMYTEFRVTRNPEREALLLGKVQAAVGKTYVVVHDDPRRNIVIDRACLPPGLPVVHVDDPRWRSDNIFDYAQVIDNSVQFHGFDSCFLVMADFLCLGARNFCHAYLRDPNMSDRFYRTGITIVRTPPPPPSPKFNPCVVGPIL